MRTLHKIALTALVLGCAALGATPAHAGIAVGIGFGGPCYRPYYGYGWYRPYGFGVYVAPPPVVIAPAPVYQVAPVAPVVQPAYSAAPPPPPPATSTTPPPYAAAGAAPEAELTPPPRLAGNGGSAYLRDLSNPDERVRSEASLQLGRMKSLQAVEPLTQVLGQDRSPAVRDAAARALGLIGSPAALTALQRAAGSDDDRDVRRSASFAADVIRGNLRR